MQKINTTIKILIAEHDTHDLAMIDNELKKGEINFVSEIVKNEVGYSKALKNFIPDIILCDYRFPSFDGPTAFKIREQLAPETPFILVSGAIGEEYSIELIKNGVTDFVLKDKLFTLNTKLVRALKEADERKEKNKIELDFKQTAAQLAEAQILAKLGSWDYDIAADKLTWSKQLYKVFDTDKETFTETHGSFLQLIDETDRNKAEQTIRLKKETGDRFILEYCITTSKGEKRIIQEHGYGVKDAVGKVIRLFGTAQDITERKIAENAVKESEAKYRAFFENSMDGILLTVTDGEILAANPAACLIFNMTEQEICDTGRFGLFDLSDPRVENLIKLRHLTGKAQGELTLLRKDGIAFAGEISSALFTDSFGQERTSMIIRDISERKAAEVILNQTSKELQHTINGLNKIMDSSMDIICTVDKAGKFVQMSAASQAIWGYSPQELINSNYLVLVYADDVEEAVAVDSEIKNGFSITMFENRFVHKNGSIVPMLWSANWDEHDQLMYCIGKDATEKKKLENANEIERQRFLGLYLQAPSCMCILKGPTHVFEMANPLYLQLVNKSNIIGKTVKEAIPELESQEFFELLDTVYKTGETFSANEMLVQFDLHGTGKLVDTYLNFIYQANRDDQNEINGILFFAIDVTEQVISRKKIEESERRLKEAQAIARVSNWEIDLVTNTHQWPQELYDIFRITPEEVKPSAEAFLSLLHPNDVEQAKESMQNTFDTFQESYFYSRINTNDGIARYIYSEWKFEFDKTNKPIRQYGILQDVTERKIAKEKIIKSNRLYAFISAINHSIVHIKEEEELLEKACSIAMEIGKFKIAWMGLLNEEDKLELINVLGERAAVQVVMKRSRIDVQNSPFQNTSVGKALRNGIYAVSNDVLNDPDMHFLKEELISTGIRANIVIPIKKSGKVIGIFSFNSDTVNFFDEAEIGLLQEATNNISFAIENFDKAKQHKKAEEEKDTLLQILQRSMNEIYIFNAESFLFEYVNQAAALNLGYSHNQLLTMTPVNIKPEYSLEKFRQLIVPLVNLEKEKIVFETVHERADKSRYDVEVHLQLVIDSGKSVYLAVILDITERKHGEEKIKYNEKRLQLATSSAGLGIWDWDIKNNILSWDEGMYRLYNILGNEFNSVYEGWFSRLHQEDQQQVENHLQLALANKKDYNPEFRIVWGDSSVHYIRASAIIERDNDGNAIRMIGVNWDVTESKLAEISLIQLNENLKQQAKELALSNAELEQFAYVASHDLQEPLRMVTSFLSQLEKKYGDVIDEKGKKYIGFAVDGAKRMRQIILDLLEISRVGRTEDNKEMVDLNELIKEIKILLRKKIQDKKAVIIIDQLPQMYTYLSPVRQIFQNLINNALEYSRKNNPVQIHIKVNDLKDHWQFAVIDDGIGIEKEYFDKIFILFQRLHNKNEYSGTGIGLAITKKIIEKQSGKIWVESEVGKGSTFYFTILK